MTSTSELASRLQFTRDGRVLVVAERDRVVIADLETTGERREIRAESIEALAVFADQIWIASSGSLLRCGLDGRALEPAPALGTGGTLVPTTVGAPAAVWTGGERTLWFEDLGQLGSLPVGEGAVPIAGRRYARVAGPTLTLPSGNAVRLEGVDRIIGGQAIFDSASLVLLAACGRTRELRTVSVTSGRTSRALAVPSGPVRLASRRGVAVVLQGRELALLDLRTGRSLGTVIADQEVDDFAIDPDAKQLALRFPSGSVELVPLAPAHAEPSRRVVPTSSVEDSPPAVAEAVASPVTERPATTSPDSADVARAVAALQPRPVCAPLDRGAALAVLDLHITSAALWTRRAIASAWNTRRLGFADEGEHPFEHEVAAIAGDARGHAQAQVDAAAQAIADHEAVLAADPRVRDPGAPLEVLAAELGLSPTAVDVVLVIAAPALDGDLARLYGILANDTSRAVVDELLVQHVLRPRWTRHEVAAELGPDAPLMRLGVVSCASRTTPFRSLEVDAVILSRLRAEAADLGVALRLEGADRTLDELDLAPGALVAAVTALARTSAPARIVVRGRAHTGRRALLAALAARAGRALGVIDATALPRDPERFTDELRRGLRRAQLAGLVPVVDGLEDVVLGERAGADLAREPLASHPGSVAVILSERATRGLPARCATIDLAPMSETQRLDVWQRLLTSSGRWMRDVAGLAARHRVGPGAIHGALAAIANEDPAAPCDDVIEQHLRRARGEELAACARVVEHRMSWSDLVLPADVMDSLRELVGRVRHRRTVFEQWGMGRKMASSAGLTALFQGQPGTGKTLVAGVIARELGLELYQVDLAKVMSKWIGETERNLARIFDAADDGQVILLFDEADSLFARRTEVRSSNDRYANLEVNYLLQRLDSFAGIAILTTNHGGSIDPAFKRRLSFQLSFPFPDETTREALWRAHLPRELPRAHELAFEGLARKYQLSGGYIRNACLRAAFLAAQEDRALHQEHLERAVALEFAEQGKLSTSGSIA